MHTLLRAVVQLLILRAVPHFHPRDVKMLLVDDLFNILGKERVRKPKPSFRSQLQGCSSPRLCPGPFSWRSPLLPRVAQLDCFEGQGPFRKTVRNASISATITFYWCKNVHFAEPLHKNALSSWADVYPVPPGCEPLELPAPACRAAEMLGCALQPSWAGEHGWLLWGWGQALLCSARAWVLCFKVRCLHVLAKLATTAQESTFPQSAQTV